MIREGSDTHRLLRELSDGRWHFSADLYYDLHIMVHSRVADLRRNGVEVECERVRLLDFADVYRYRIRQPVKKLAKPGNGLVIPRKKP